MFTFRSFQDLANLWNRNLFLPVGIITDLFYTFIQNYYRTVTSLQSTISSYIKITKGDTKMKKTTIAFIAILSILILSTICTISLAGIKLDGGFRIILSVLAVISELVNYMCIIALLIRPDKAD